MSQKIGAGDLRFIGKQPFCASLDARYRSANCTQADLIACQFDECNLTLNELRIVEESLTKSLIGIYHGRIKYPEQRIA